MGQLVGLCSDGQRVASVLLGYPTHVAAICDPGELVREQGTNQVAVAVHLPVFQAVFHFDDLVDVERVVPARTETDFPCVPGCFLIICGALADDVPKLALTHETPPATEIPAPDHLDQLRRRFGRLGNG